MMLHSININGRWIHRQRHVFLDPNKPHGMQTDSLDIPFLSHLANVDRYRILRRDFPAHEFPGVACAVVVRHSEVKQSSKLEYICQLLYCTEMVRPV